ncbi:DUF927 domain-containing protein [Methanococcoides sp. SA1]|nr:DUF927 domain-containing protein [Methanococcoides sp. SA1]
MAGNLLNLSKLNMNYSGLDKTENDLFIDHIGNTYNLDGTVNTINFSSYPGTEEANKNDVSLLKDTLENAQLQRMRKNARLEEMNKSVGSAEIAPYKHADEGIRDKAIEITDANRALELSKLCNAEGLKIIKGDDGKDLLIDEDCNMYDINGTFMRPSQTMCCGIKLPVGYNVIRGHYGGEVGIYEVKLIESDYGASYEVRTQVSGTPVVISGKGMKYGSLTPYYQLSFVTDEGKKTIIVKLSDIITTKGLRELIDNGLRITDISMKGAIKYFNALINECSDQMKPIFLSDINGWTDDCEIFIYGEKGFTKDGVVDIIMTDEQALEVLSASGSISEFVNGTKELLNYPLARFKLYASTVSLILSLLNINNFLVDHYGLSSSGKTILMQIVCAFFGNPNINGLMNSEMTKFAIEDSVVKFNCLPIFIDETSATDSEDLGKLVYILGNGSTKARGNKNGKVDKGVRFSTVPSFTGEKPINDQKKLEGHKVRVIEITEQLPTGIGELVDSTSNCAKNNYGHFIEPFIMEIMKNKDNLQKMYGEACERITTDNNMERRRANNFAVIEVVAKIIEPVLIEAGYFPQKVEEIIDHFFETTVRDKPIEKSHIHALETTIDWISSHPKNFGQCKDDSGTLIAKESGFQKYGWKLPSYYDIIPSELESVLKGAVNTAFKDILLRWKEDGITIANGRKDGRYTASHGINTKKQQRVIRIDMLKAKEMVGILVDSNQSEIAFSEQDTGIDISNI